MSNNNRSRGDYLERQTRRALEACGWFVIRAGGSHGAADLLALRKGDRPLLIQCKILGAGRTMPRVDPAERNAIWAAANVAGGRPIIATRYRAGYVALLELPGIHSTQYTLTDELYAGVP